MVLWRARCLEQRNLLLMEFKVRFNTGCDLPTNLFTEKLKSMCFVFLYYFFIGMSYSLLIDLARNVNHWIGYHSHCILSFAFTFECSNTVKRENVLSPKWQRRNKAERHTITKASTTYKYNIKKDTTTIYK